MFLKRLKNFLSKSTKYKITHNTCFSVNAHSNLDKNPTSLHLPVMLTEVLDKLELSDGSTFIDLTFGGGGHSVEILKRYPQTKVFALDRDERAISIANEVAKEFPGRLIPIVGKMSEVCQLLEKMGHHGEIFNGAIIDAGCSSMQFDEAERGFSLSKDGPLDMRMDGSRLNDQITAADVVNNLPEKDLANIIKSYGNEENAKLISTFIVENRPIHTTKMLASVIEQAFSSGMIMSNLDSLGRRRHVATKTFLALRIFINDEMNELYEGIVSAENLLKSEGKLCVLSFQSSEDRVVKKALRRIDDIKLRINSVERHKNNDSVKVWKDLKTYFPKEVEIGGNPRSRSATLRVATKT